MREDSRLKVLGANKGAEGGLREGRRDKVLEGINCWLLKGMMVIKRLYEDKRRSRKERQSKGVVT